MRGRRTTAITCLWLTAAPCFGQQAAPAPAASGSSTRIGGAPIRPAASEYYTTDSEAGRLDRVHIWGDVSKPGVYYIPVSSSLEEAVSMAGGPTPTANLDSVRIRRGNEVQYASLLGADAQDRLYTGDTIYVERSLKADLPLIYGTIGTALSLAAFYFAMSRAK